MKCSLDISNFLKRSLVFSILLFSSISLHCSLKKAFLSFLAILWNSACNQYIFPCLPCILLLFFSELFIRLHQFLQYSKVNQLYLHIYLLFFRFFSRIGHYRVLRSTPCGIQQVLVWHPTPLLLPGKSHGRRSLEGCSPWGR